MFFVVGRKGIAIIVSVIIVIAMITTFFCVNTEIPPYVKTIVIDAGHGGIDGGCVGKRYGAIESELNLAYSQELKKMCENFGFRVIMTRETAEGLYSPLASNKKKSEMQQREKIICESKCDILISIHMNSLNIASVKGAQAFYKKGSEEGKKLADSITESLAKGGNKIRNGATVGDYYVLNCNEKAGVLIECGYLSNAEEEYQLMQKEYRKTFCENVFYGIVNYLKN